MLVLSRKPGQELVIGDDVRVAVLSVRGDKVRLGITAPPEIPVHRREVHDRLTQSGALAGDARRRTTETGSNA